jgi:predicted alpha/beta hydrolase family esterase
MSLLFLNVTGLSNSGELHWQSIWEKANPTQLLRVQQDNWEEPQKDDWITRLNETIQQQEQHIVLIAHSLGCLTVAHWANSFPSQKIKAALLVAPPDANRTDEFAIIESFSPVPTQALPFPSLVIASTNDEYASIERSEEMAQAWGSDFINLGAFGHINATTNLGLWEEGQALLKHLLTKSAIETTLLFES